MMMTRTKVANYLIATGLIAMGVGLDHSGAMGAEALHHVAFILGGVFIGMGVNK